MTVTKHNGLFENNNSSIRRYYRLAKVVTFPTKCYIYKRYADFVTRNRGVTS